MPRGRETTRDRTRAGIPLLVALPQLSVPFGCFWSAFQADWSARAGRRLRFARFLPSLDLVQPGISAPLRARGAQRRHWQGSPPSVAGMDHGWFLAGPIDTKDAPVKPSQCLPKPRPDDCENHRVGANVSSYTFRRCFVPSIAR